MGRQNSELKSFQFLCSAVLFGVSHFFRLVGQGSLGILLPVKLFVHQLQLLTLNQKSSYPFDSPLSTTNSYQPYATSPSTPSSPRPPSPLPPPPAKKATYQPNSAAIPVKTGLSDNYRRLFPH
jgi:hypothetical protein